MLLKILFISVLSAACVNSLAFNPATARRSVARFTDAPVASAVVDAALEAAILAPNHFLSEPWRFYIPGEKTMKALNELVSLCNERSESHEDWRL